jgi:ABC-2 type transport system permease protein
MVLSWSASRQIIRKYRAVAVFGWQDSLVYRFNALVWVLYAVVPSLTLMLVWLAAYGGNHSEIGGYDLRQMLTYYLCVTLLSVAITPNPEWDIATVIRDGKITPFLVRPISYFWFRFAWESSYQIVKTAMSLPAFMLLGWLFRDYIELPAWNSGRIALFLCASLGAYLILSQLKFLLGISAFWIAEPGGFMEIWNVLNGLFAGRLLPLTLLPVWAQTIGMILPFSILYAFPLEILLGRATPESILFGFMRQAVWLAVLTGMVRWSWRRGLLAYEAYGG